MEVDTKPARRPSTQSSNTNGPRKRPSRGLRQQQQPVKQEEAVDDSAWIHRDKLAQIEIQEMEQAGMHVRQPHRADSVSQMRSSSRAASRTGIRRTPSKDQIAGSAGEDEQYIEQERKRVSTIHAAEEEDYQGVESELRTQDETTAEPQAYRQHTARPSTSKIPISKASSAATPANGASEKNSPRSRSGSNAFPTTWDDLQDAKRLRSNSTGSGILLDDDDAEAAQIPPTQTQSKAKSASKTTPNRKPLNEVATNRSTPSARPPSSSGHATRPSTSHARPEGDPPWLATMYKPDPRLPPDQQMLPTHAKRMMQEQWEKEGKIGNAYDRDLRLMNDKEIKLPEKTSKKVDENPSSARVVEEPKPDMPQNKENIVPPASSQQEEPWPIVTGAIADIRTESPRPSTSGGYRTTPTIRVSSPSVHLPPTINADVIEHPTTARQNVPRMQEYDEKTDDKPRKGCCCVVM